MSTTLPPIDTTITSEDVRTGYKVWKEHTTTAPSGIHLGHFTAVLKWNETPQALEQPSLADRLFTIQARFLQAAITNNIIYDRWKKVVTIMIEKQPGNPTINKLRALHLFENDFNLLLGILWGKRLLRNGENHNAINEAQYGSRNNRSTQDALTFKHFAYGISRLTKTDLISFDNDAKACYDRIVLLLGMLCSRKLGMPAPVCKFYINAYDHLQYHIQTAFGTSRRYYTNTTHVPIHGPGQGNRSSPSMWVIISSLLMSCVQDNVSGLQLCDPTQQQTIHQTMIGFVDDTTHWVNNFIHDLEHQPILEPLMEQMISIATLWERLLHTSGGKLELSKCFYYMMIWIFNHEGEAHLAHFDPQQTTGVTVQDSETNEHHDIQICQSSTSHKTLGVYENPSGDYTDEIARLQQKITKKSLPH